MNFEDLPENATDVVVEQHAMAYTLWRFLRHHVSPSQVVKSTFPLRYDITDISERDMILKFGLISVQRGNKVVESSADNNCKYTEKSDRLNYVSGVRTGTLLLLDLVNHPI